MIHLIKKHWLHAIAGLFGLFVIVVAAAFLFSAFQASTGFVSQSTGFSNKDMAMELAMPTTPAGMGRGVVASDSFMEQAEYYPEPIPVPTLNGYTSGLETYETTSYNLFARSRDFDELCTTLGTIKGDDAIHFKYLNTSLNNCSARFFVAGDRAAAVLDQFESFQDVEVTRNTESVTRHREQIESQTTIVRQQLESVERTLAEAEVAYDEIVAFARANNDAETLSNAINQKLRQIDSLTGRKISLTSQLDNLAQQAVDLNERLDVVEFYASFSRSNPIISGEYERQWERARDDLRDQFTATLIGVTAFFGIFLLYLVQYGLYLLVLILVARYGWKIVRIIWQL